MSESETTTEPYIVQVSRGTREAILGVRRTISEIPTPDLRNAWIVLDALASDLRGELKKRGATP